MNHIYSEKMKKLLKEDLRLSSSPLQPKICGPSKRKGKKKEYEEEEGLEKSDWRASDSNEVNEKEKKYFIRRA